MLTSGRHQVRRESEEIEEAAKIEFSETNEDSKEKVKRAKLAVLRRLHQYENFKTFLEHGNYNSMILRNPTFNKGTAFTHEERSHLNIQGLLPPRVETLDNQCSQVIDFLDTLQNNLQKYMFLMNLSERNETIFYKLLCDHPQTYLPLIATSNLAEGYQQYSRLWMFQKGLFLSLNEKGKLRKILDNWIFPKVDIVVVTDGSQVLGLRDLGCNAMGISIEKSMLYVAAGGFHPTRTLAISLDVGTSNDELRDRDEHYLGMRIHRVEDRVYYPFMDEVMQAIQGKWPHAVVQFQDFSSQHAHDLLERYQKRFLCFNDDIQVTSVVVLAGLLNACRLIGSKMNEQRFLFVDTESMALDIANQIVQESTERESDDSFKVKVKQRIWMMDQRGMVTAAQGQELFKEKEAYAREDWPQGSPMSLVDVIEKIRPTVLIGTSGKKSLFNEQVLRKMADIQEHPIIMVLSSLNDDAECTFEEAINCTNGRCIFISGSPFKSVQSNKRCYECNNANKMYAFPGIGLGACLAQATSITDSMLLRAARTLATMVSENDLFENSLLYPAQDHIRTISHTIAMAVLDQAFEAGVACIPRPDYPLRDYIRNSMYYPQYF